MQRALVTGAGGTFGRFIAAALVAQGYETLCVVRDAAKGAVLLARLAANAPAGGGAGRARAVECDLSSRADIARAIGGALAGAPLDVLVNNAAVTPETRTLAADGTELQWCVNVLAYQRVLRAALPALRAARAPRVVFVASQYAGGLDIGDAQFAERPYEPHAAYKASKQADRMLAAAWAAREPRLAVFACHPGVAASGVARGLRMVFDDSDAAGARGAATPAFLATADAAALAPSGAYYVDKKPIADKFTADAAAVDALFAAVDAAA